MGPRAALILAVAVAVAACGDTSSAFDMSAIQDMGQPGGPDLGHLGCQISINIGTTSDVPPATLTASIDPSATGASSPMWNVQRAGDSAAMPTVGATPFIVSFAATQPGTYTFFLDTMINGVDCKGSASVELHNPMGAIRNYRLRALPPESAGLPLTDVLLSLQGGTPRANVDIALSSGTGIVGFLHGPGMDNVVGEVRLIASEGPDALATTDANGGFKLAVLSDGKYQPLLIPQASTLAPHLGGVDTGINFANATFSVGAGEPVTGSVVDGAAAGIMGARVVLRAGALPSGVGTAAANGSFTLRAEATTYALSVGADGWPIANAAAVAVPSGGVNLAIAYTVSRVAVAGKVVRADGTTPVAAARVTIVSRPLGNVATLAVGSGSAQPIQGHFLGQAISDANGNLPALQLPPGTYDLIVEPPAGLMPEGLTAVTQVLSGAATWTLALQPRNTLAGKISDGNGNGVAGVTVTALELAGLAAAPTAVSDASGSYGLAVDPGAPMQVEFAPPSSVRLGDLKLSLPAGTTHADAVLPPGLYVSGHVRNPSGNGQARVLVEALCYDCGSTEPITSYVTDPDGSYTIYLPDPGNLLFDMGTD